MATLKTSHHSSAYTARSRLNQVIHEHAVPQPAPEIVQLEAFREAKPATQLSTGLAYKEASVPNNYPGVPNNNPQTFSDIDQHQLLLQTVKVYDGWHLVSIQHRPDNGSIVAYLVRNTDQSDPSLAIREGRALQVIMDSVGDMQIHHASRHRVGFWQRLFGRFNRVSPQQF